VRSKQGQLGDKKLKTASAVLMHYNFLQQIFWIARVHGKLFLFPPIHFFRFNDNIWLGRAVTYMRTGCMILTVPYLRKNYGILFFVVNLRYLFKPLEN
jgi:hypothetical protein